jgi:cold shock CspA family protein
MRFDGKLDKWNDERGFGFITPLKGGEPVFVHISAFEGGARPQVGEALTFEVEPAGDGKKRAVHVQRPGSRRPAPPLRTREPRRASAPRRGSSLVPAVVAAMLIGGGGYGVMQFTRSRAPAAPQTDTAPTQLPARVTSPAYRCDGRTHCSQMTSCAEATFFLRNCPGTQMDGDGDGIPCERQWCQ